MVGAFLFMRIERASCCKVNLILNILGKRSDGFHELETLMHPVAIHDRLIFEEGGAGIQLECEHPDLPLDEGNLVYRAARDFLAEAGIKEGVRIRIEKRIPLAAGLGGGSGNAANTLLGLSELFGWPLARAELHRLAARLGSDVPFFLQEGPALGLGRGERIEPLPALGALRDVHILLVHPGFGVSTPWAYKNLGRFPDALQGEAGRAKRLAEELQTGTIESAAKDFHNGLELPVLEKYPLLQIFLEFYRERGAVVALMSGSGSTTFGLFRGESDCAAAAGAFVEEFGPSCWVARARLAASA